MVSASRRDLAWTAGYNAQLAGKSREACNRQPGTIYFDDWHDGYNHAENTAATRSGSAS